MPIDENWLIEAYRPRVLYFTLRRLRDRATAEDVIQEALLAVIAAVRKNHLKDETKLGSFVFAVAENMVRKQFRARAREGEISEEERETRAMSWLGDPEAALLVEEQRKQVREGLKKLSSTDREVLEHCFGDPKPLEQLAKNLGVSYSSLRKRKSRALDRLRQILLGVTKSAELKPNE